PTAPRLRATTNAPVFPSPRTLASVTNVAVQANKGDLNATRQLFLRGAYDRCVVAAKKALAEDDAEDEWALLLIQSFLVTGRYTNAQSVVATNLSRFRNSVRLRLLGHDAA